MKTRLTLLLILVVLSPILLMAHNDTCKVLLPQISGTYIGECLNGLAHGKGTAKGIDSYEGSFLNGLPNGKGKYTYQNGNVFAGYWLNGLKNGQGKFTYFIQNKKYVQEGYWKDDNYIGLRDSDDFYRIKNRVGTENFEIKKVNDKPLKINITFFAAMTRYVPSDLNISTSTGQVSRENLSFSIYNFQIPNLCEITYTIKTAGGDKICKISFDILKPGNYEVRISNIE